VSRIAWSSILVPPAEAQATELRDGIYQDTIENVLPIPLANNEIAVPDPKAFRSMSRASIFLSHICMGAKDALAPFLDQSPFSVGVYCAVENGPIDAPSTAKIVEAGDPTRFAELYRKFRNPKTYLKQLPNLAPAQMGISMGLQGPMNVYTHTLSGGIHALEQAEWDLKEGVVQAALVCSSHAFDDFLVVKRSRGDDPRVLTEGAAAALLVADGRFTEWSASLAALQQRPDQQSGQRGDQQNSQPTNQTNKQHNNRWFGIADPVIHLFLTEENRDAN